MTLAWLTHSALAAAYRGEHRRLTGLNDLGRAQQDVLTGILARNRDCDVGRRYSFAGLRDADDFRSRVPLSSWDDYAAAVDRIMAGETQVLTAEPVRLLEPSSGSTAAVKLIPYTAGLKAEYQRGVKAWLHDLYTAHPRLRAGRSYWSITPAMSAPIQPSAVPIGFDEDADYLGPWGKRLMRSVFAVDSDVVQAATMAEFKNRTCRQLLAAEDLSLVSVWNPTFFDLLLDWILEHAAELTAELPRARRDQIQACLADEDWSGIWPHLGMVSCWADAAAAGPADTLMARLPGVAMQPKGLLATEGIISIPLTQAAGAVLAARSHFFEFLPEGTSETVLAHQLQTNHRYTVVITTSGGLYRYRLGDLIEVIGWSGALPILRLCGRTDKVSDLVGEKLNEAFVTAVFAELGLTDAVLIPETNHYTVRTASTRPDLAEQVDAALRANPHYDYARRLGQLGPVVAAALRPQNRLVGSANARLGAIKATALQTLTHHTREDS